MSEYPISLFRIPRQRSLYGLAFAILLALGLAFVPAVQKVRQAAQRMTNV